MDKFNVTKPVEYLNVSLYLTIILLKKYIYYILLYYIIKPVKFLHQLLILLSDKMATYSIWTVYKVSSPFPQNHIFGFTAKINKKKINIL